MYYCFSFLRSCNHSHFHFPTIYRRHLEFIIHPLLSHFFPIHFLYQMEKWEIESISTPLLLWRPITLLNVDYKIASKAIAKRIEHMLPSLIHPDQTGFVKGRYIGENIRLISDIMEQTKKLNCPGILLSLDFQKAFDTLEWSCIHNVLKIYNFGDSLRNWIKVFYTDIESAILTNWIKPSNLLRA